MLQETINQLKELNTRDLLTVIKALTEELQDRDIPDNWEGEEQYKGGTRPTHQPINP